MPTKIAINGFGRIGRSSFKIATGKPNVEIAAINDLTNPRILAHLLKYDTAYGVFMKDIYLEEDGNVVRLESYRGEKDFYKQTATKTYIVVDGHKTLVLSEKDPANLPWKDLGIDVVLECTGRFTDNDSAFAHINAGAKKVVISAPSKGGLTPTILYGANHDKYQGQPLVSNASCTTNCISPVVNVMHSKFKIIKSMMTTVHAVTAEQNVVDSAPPPLHPDLRRARSSGYNMIPTTTGAAKATTEAIPDLKNKFDGIAIRVPVITGSVADITMLVEKKTTVEEVNKTIIEATKNPFYKDILNATYEPIVSSDIIGSPFSSIVDLGMTKVVDGDMVKVLAWYDNEWGYSNRLVEMALMVTGK